MKRPRLSCLASLGLSFTVACAACGGSPETIEGSDGGPNVQDSSSPTPTPDGTIIVVTDDAGEDATSPGEDSGTPGDDGGQPSDDASDGASPPEDAGVDSSEGVDSSDLDATKPDASEGTDASEHDASKPDASEGTDASEHDASEPDASKEVDAGTDSGVDAGPPPAESLTVTTSGFGIVTSSPSAISCPKTCTTTYPKGTPVTLTATPSAGQTFKGWSGACAGTTSTTCDVTVDAATTAGAEFSETYPTPATVDASYNCSIFIPSAGITETATLALAFTDATPTNVPPGATFGMDGFQIVASLPGTFATTLTGYGYTSISGQGTTLDINSNDASNTTLNPAATSPSDYAFSAVAVTSGTAITIPLPASPATIGTFTAVSSGTMSFTAGQLAMNLVLTGSKGILGSPLDATMTCPAPAPVVTIATTSVP